MKSPAVRRRLEGDLIAGFEMLMGPLAKLLVGDLLWGKQHVLMLIDRGDDDMLFMNINAHKPACFHIHILFC